MRPQLQIPEVRSGCGAGKDLLHQNTMMKMTIELLKQLVSTRRFKEKRVLTDDEKQKATPMLLALID